MFTLVLALATGVHAQSPENATPSARDSSKPLKVFVCSGQSNMVGMQTRPASLPPELQKAQSNLIFNGEQWVPLGPKNPTSPESSGESGPEISFAMEMSKALGEPVGIVKCAFAGRPIGHWKRKQFNPPFESQHESMDKDTLMKHGLYYVLLDMVLKAKNSRPVEIVGMLWMQGESDSSKPELAAAYGENLASLIADARRDFGAPEMVFVAGRVNPPEPPLGPNAEAPVVRKAQEECAAPRYAWIDCDDLTKAKDNLHYDTAGIVEMGRRFATAAQSLMSNSADSKKSGIQSPEDQR